MGLPELGIDRAIQSKSRVEVATASSSANTPRRASTVRLTCAASRRFVGLQAEKVCGGGQLEKFRVDLADLVDRLGEPGQQVAAPLPHPLDRRLHLGWVGHLPGHPVGAADGLVDRIDGAGDPVGTVSAARAAWVAWSAVTVIACGEPGPLQPFEADPVVMQGVDQGGLRRAGTRWLRRRFGRFELTRVAAKHTADDRCDAEHPGADQPRCADR